MYSPGTRIPFTQQQQPTENRDEEENRTHHRREMSRGAAEHKYSTNSPLSPLEKSSLPLSRVILEFSGTRGC